MCVRFSPVDRLVQSPKLFYNQSTGLHQLVTSAAFFFSIERSEFEYEQIEQQLHRHVGGKHIRNELQKHRKQQTEIIKSYKNNSIKHCTTSILKCTKHTEP